MEINKGEHVFEWGKTRDKNGPIGNKKSKQIGMHYVAKETPECIIKIASNKGSLIWSGNYTPICFDVKEEMLNHITKGDVT